VAIQGDWRDSGSRRFARDDTAFNNHSGGVYVLAGLVVQSGDICSFGWRVGAFRCLSGVDNQVAHQRPNLGVIVQPLRHGQKLVVLHPEPGPRAI
jgi:hypothetical protein